MFFEFIIEDLRFLLDIEMNCLYKVVIVNKRYSFIVENREEFLFEFVILALRHRFIVVKTLSIK